jgi:hypothetical protein
MSLQDAPEHVVLAVDLIELLEANQVPAATVLAALELVKRDYLRKLQAPPATGQQDARDFERD